MVMVPPLLPTSWKQRDSRHLESYPSVKTTTSHHKSGTPSRPRILINHNHWVSKYKSQLLCASSDRWSVIFMQPNTRGSWEEGRRDQEREGGAESEEGGKEGDWEWGRRDWEKGRRDWEKGRMDWEKGRREGGTEREKGEEEIWSKKKRERERSGERKRERSGQRERDFSSPYFTGVTYAFHYPFLLQAHM